MLISGICLNEANSLRQTGETAAININKCSPEHSIECDGFEFLSVLSLLLLYTWIQPRGGSRVFFFFTHAYNHSLSFVLFPSLPTFFSFPGVCAPFVYTLLLFLHQSFASRSVVRSFVDIRQWCNWNDVYEEAISRIAAINQMDVCIPSHLHCLSACWCHSASSSFSLLWSWLALFLLPF